MLLTDSRVVKEVYITRVDGSLSGIRGSADGISSSWPPDTSPRRPPSTPWAYTIGGRTARQYGTRSTAFESQFQYTGCAY